MQNVNKIIEEQNEAPVCVHDVLFAALDENEIDTFKDGLGMLKLGNQRWLCHAVLVYRNRGVLLQNRNPFMNVILRKLIGIQ